MSKAVLTSKGQITIPAPVRKALGISRGDRVEFVEIGSGRYELIAARRSVSALKGMVKSRNVVSIDTMNVDIMRRGASAAFTSE